MHACYKSKILLPPSCIFNAWFSHAMLNCSHFEGNLLQKCLEGIGQEKGWSKLQYSAQGQLGLGNFRLDIGGRHFLPHINLHLHISFYVQRYLPLRKLKYIPLLRFRSDRHTRNKAVLVKLVELNSH